MAKRQTKVLILGGTGAMGTSLVNLLSDMEEISQIVVTSRQDRKSEGKVKYIKGNALDISFITTLLAEQKWNVIVDFMAYGTEEFSQRYSIFLENCDQYIFTSSCRVYNKCDDEINEQTGRLLDSCKDEEYLKTDEYALSKARQEDLLFQSPKKNYTIIRPSITYNSYRLQLGVLEKENWLYRAMHGRDIVFSRDIADKLTSFTCGTDVARAMCSIIGKSDALGEVFHITYPKSYTWEQILEVYLNTIEKICGRRPNVVFTDKTTCFKANWNKYQIIYCRYFNRRFNNEKIAKYIDIGDFVDIENGIFECLAEFFLKPQFGNINWVLEAVNDRVCKQYTPLKEIASTELKIKYICYRYGLGIAWKIIAKSLRIIKRMCGNV